MANFVFAYKGGAEPGTEEEGKAVMGAWMAWFGKIGPAIVDAGNPFDGSKTVATNGAVSDGGTSDLSGYSIVSAPDLTAASEMAKGCPILTSGGSVEVYEIHPMM